MITIIQKKVLSLSAEILIPAGVLTICIVTAGIFLAFKHPVKKPVTVNQLTLPTPVSVPKNVTDLLNSVGQKTQLPTGETPSVATVTDVTKLPENIFFSKAQNGDKVLLYTTQKKAYLYRPSTGEIIDEATIDVVDSNDQNATSSSEMTATGSATISGSVLQVKL